jgi:hypothetical protein
VVLVPKKRGGRVNGRPSLPAYHTACRLSRHIRKNSIKSVVYLG